MVNESLETNVEGIFACGNVLQVHDLVDFVSEEAEIAGKSAAFYALNGKKEKEIVLTAAGNFVSYVLPQKINLKGDEDVSLYFRVNATIPNPKINLRCGDKIISSFKKTVVVPGEMQRVKLSADKFGEISETITVEIER